MRKKIGNKGSAKTAIIIALVIIAIATAVFVFVGKSLKAKKDNDSTTTTAAETEATTEEEIKGIDFTDVSVGDYITLGKYEQDNDKKETEDIEWLVLDIQDSKALVISRYALDCMPYNDTLDEVTWESCSLRKYLNGEFVAAAFTDEEDEMILPTLNTNEGNSEFDTQGGKDTNDKVFLLSEKEFNKYFVDNEIPFFCSPTAYAESQGSYRDDGTYALDAALWWLRTPGVSNDMATEVITTGFKFDGAPVTNEWGSEEEGYVPAGVSVRPAMWVSIKNSDKASDSSDSIFSEIAGTYYFASGVGGWGTELTIKNDGSFEGNYYDSDYENGDNYTTVLYNSSFSGKFVNPEKTGKTTYSLEIEDLEYDKNINAETIDDGIKYVTSEPYGIVGDGKFTICLPGTDTTTMTEEVKNWIHLSEGEDKILGEGEYVLINVSEDLAFVRNDIEG